MVFLSVVRLNVGADLPGHRAEVQKWRVEVHSSHTHRFLRVIMAN